MPGEALSVRFLLERLEAGADEGFPLEAAVGLQLSRLVAVHEWELPPGMGEELGLGLPSVVDLGHGRDLARYAESLQAVIRRHEPRLGQARVLVEAAGPHASPRLVVVATLADESGPRPFRFMLPED